MQIKAYKFQKEKVESGIYPATNLKYDKLHVYHDWNLRGLFPNQKQGSKNVKRG